MQLWIGLIASVFNKYDMLFSLIALKYSPVN